MNFKVTAGYFCPLTDTALADNQFSGLLGVTFKYECNLVYPENAGPNFGVLVDDQPVDLFDNLYVCYDGQKVQAAIMQNLGPVEFVLVGGRYEYANHDFREMSLTELNENLQVAPDMLSRQRMVVSNFTYRRYHSRPSEHVVSGPWGIGDAQGFQLADPAQFPSAVQTAASQLATEIGALSRQLQETDPRMVTVEQASLGRETRLAQLRAWYHLTRQPFTTDQVLERLQTAYLKNLDYLQALQQPS
ncbi:hypothetical protein [Lactiplantibacillus modestisalitolerans]|uniref:Uncharacterized protein n=1 Tax=Lactiplantibacillus modestisalitolerans TaxID=1457219 RepID=A0ABV5WTR4_9LACO|nr:hypothetical protein [Lactiplantibacillus modestisalitolerans]